MIELCSLELNHQCECFVFLFSSSVDAASMGVLFKMKRDSCASKQERGKRSSVVNDENEWMFGMSSTYNREQNCLLSPKFT